MRGYDHRISLGKINYLNNGYNGLNHIGAEATLALSEVGLLITL
jgi:hypothetical protein